MEVEIGFVDACFGAWVVDGGKCEVNVFDALFSLHLCTKAIFAFKDHVDADVPACKFSG
jgi:hypothetical protein